MIPWLWAWLIPGYLLTVAIETPVLWFLLHPRHPPRRRLVAGLWLTACTYPAVVLFWPMIFAPGEERTLYLLAAETTAHVGECVLFLAAFGVKTAWRDSAAVLAANLASFVPFELLHQAGRW